MTKRIDLKYGLNPSQARAWLETKDQTALPLEIVNGLPGYINLLDALRGWQLVKEIKEATGHVAAASFKHVNPAGAGIDLPIQADESLFEGLPARQLSGPALAYARARSGDPVASFGDFVAVSDRVDESLAQLLKGVVSDGIIAPSYEPGAVAILKEKKKGGVIILKIDPEFAPGEMEKRDLFGMDLVQSRDAGQIGKADFKNSVTRQKNIPDDVLLTMLVTSIAVKHSQSNTVGIGIHGQIIGLGCGQQSRIHCTRLACSRAEKWAFRQHPKLKNFQFGPDISFTDRNNLIDQFLEWDSLSPYEVAAFEKQVPGHPAPLGVEERAAALPILKQAVLVSDAFIPFRDNIDRAAKSSISFIAQTGGSLRDAEVTEAADGYGMVMAHTGKRLFLH